jgi:hypothetical protein
VNPSDAKRRLAQALASARESSAPADPAALAMELILFMRDCSLATADGRPLPPVPANGGQVLAEVCRKIRESYRP